MRESWRTYLHSSCLNFCFIVMKSFVDYSVVFVADSPQRAGRRWGARRRRFDFDRPAVAVAGSDDGDADAAAADADQSQPRWIWY